MKMKKVWSAAHTEYFLVRNGVEYFNGCCYRSAKTAQKEADLMNARRNTERYGVIEVRSKEREGTWSYQTTLRL